MNSIIRLVLVVALGMMLGGLAEADPPFQQRVTGTCAVGSAIRVINADGSVVCETDDNSGGTVTSVGTGSGLTGGPITTSGTVSVDSAQVQTRVTGSCSGGSSIRVINQNGSVECETDDVGVTDVTASAPLASSGGTTPNISLPGVIIDGGFPFNTAIGSFVLSSNTTGSANTASGRGALSNNTTGSDNTASGIFALAENETGNNNTATGAGALFLNRGGNDNIALGFQAGLNLRSGDNNIYLGNIGPASPSDESTTMRLGSGQTRTFIAGIAGVTVANSAAVLIDTSTGQVGTLVSSIRYKNDIQPMGAHSGGLLQLRPVTFRYKEDVQGERQYGLIAEEVATVYPELVTRAATGEVQAVKYHELIPMLLNEVQRQQQAIKRQEQELAEVTLLRKELAELRALVGPR